MPPAYAYNYIERKIARWNFGKKLTVPTLTEKMALELGAHLLGELFIFAISAILVIYEYTNQLAKEEKKRKKAKQQQEDLIKKLTDMATLLERQESEIKEIAVILHDVAKDKVERSSLSQKLKEAERNLDEIKDSLNM